jgi:hypothetical protein
VSQLFAKLKVSPGGGLLSDGSATICVGQAQHGGLPPLQPLGADENPQVDSDSCTLTP